MVETVDDRIADVLNRFTSAHTTNLCFDCNADGLDKERAVVQMMSALSVSREFAEKRYQFFTDPLWCTGFPHYWYGRWLMRASLARMRVHVPAVVRMVYTEVHTVPTLRAAIDAYLAGQGSGHGGVQK